MKIVITELIWPIGIEMLKKANYEVVYDQDLWKDKERMRLELKDANALIIRNQTQVNKELLKEADDLKVVGRLGVGLNNIDLDYMSQREIPVIFAKNANATSVVEYVLASIFSSSRLIGEASNDVKIGNWNRKKYTGTEVSGQTLGLIGIGEIGHRTAVRAKAMGMQVLGYDPYVSPFDFPITESGIHLSAFDEVIAKSDFISLHVPLTEGTENLINFDEMVKMKSTAYIINTSRGGIVNEQDLAKAIKRNEISGAFLDVLEEEPPSKSNVLLNLDNCIITPHIAGLTEESQIRTSEMVAKEVINELEGRKSICRVKL